MAANALLIPATSRNRVKIKDRSRSHNASQDLR